MARIWRVGAVAIVLVAAGALLAPGGPERTTLTGGGASNAGASSGSGQKSERGKRRGGPNGQEAVPILTATAAQADVPVYVGAVGTARPAATVIIRPQVDGQITSILFREG